MKKEGIGKGKCKEEDKCKGK